MLFRFESDFAGSLRCIPMVVRLKLDLCGIKLSLRQWSRFTHDDRDALTRLSVDGPGEIDAYHARVLALVAARSDEPARFLESQPHDDWSRPDMMPASVVTQAQADGLEPPTRAQWALLDPLQRFALVKLSRSRHENENFAPAMIEFGLASGAVMSA